MKSLIPFALLALLSTASSAAPLRTQHLTPKAPAEADAKVDNTLTDDDVRGQVHTYLSAIDTPIERSRWIVLGPRAEAPLLEVLNGNELPTKRAKAIDGLSAVGTSHTALLQSIAGNESEAFVVRFAAVRGLGNLLPAPEMVRALSPLLSGAKDVRIRAAAGKTIVLHAPDAASCKLVKSQVRKEPAEQREYFAKATATCFAK